VKGILKQYYSGANILEKHPADLLVKPELPTELVRAARLDMKRCTTTKGNKVISKGHQLVRSIII